MPTIYERASEEVEDTARAVIEKHFPDLKEAAPRIDYLFARSESGPALKLSGYPCTALVRIVGKKDRAKGQGDAEICIDEEQWEDMTPEEKTALLDHELYHLRVNRGDDGQIKVDEYSRPSLSMRKHDIQAGWFIEVAQRNGQHSAEVQQARDIYDDHGQTLFPWMLTLSGESQKPTRRKRRAAVTVEAEPAAAAA
jgi:hypothetical protein